MDGYEAIGLFCYEAIRLLVAHGPWSVSFTDFQQHLLFSHRPHISVPILAFQSKTQEPLVTNSSGRFVRAKQYELLFALTLHSNTRVVL